MTSDVFALGTIAGIILDVMPNEPSRPRHIAVLAAPGGSLVPTHHYAQSDDVQARRNLLSCGSSMQRQRLTVPVSGGTSGTL